MCLIVFWFFKQLKTSETVTTVWCFSCNWSSLTFTRWRFKSDQTGSTCSCSRKMLLQSQLQSNNWTRTQTYLVLINNTGSEDWSAAVWSWRSYFCPLMTAAVNTVTVSSSLTINNYNSWNSEEEVLWGSSSTFIFTMRTSVDLCFCLLVLCGLTSVLYGEKDDHHQNVIILCKCFSIVSFYRRNHRLSARHVIYCFNST